MLDLPSADGPAETFGLAPRVTRGEAAGPPTSANIELTTPRVTPITEALTEGDAELAAFWKAEKDRFKYDYVTFRVTFTAPADSIFDRAWVELTLGGASGPDGPVAWSMGPQQLTDTVKETGTAKLGVAFKIFTAELGGEREVAVATSFLRAWKEQTNKPYWEFQRTDTTKLTGTFALHLVVRSPVGTAVQGAATARAVVDRRSFWIFRSSNPAEPATMRFDLPAIVA